MDNDRAGYAARVPTPTAPPDAGEARRRIPALDGLRGLAILLVFVKNLNHQRFSGEWTHALLARLHQVGWVGVDLFFVLSGFLITDILVSTRESPRYFRNFYARRFLRIFPLYYGVLIAMFVVLPPLKVLAASATRELLHAQGWYWTYTVNVLVALHGDEAAPLSSDHFWSLAVEEQFYLLWPLIVWRLSPRRLAQLCVVVFLATLVLRFVAFALGATPNAVYVSTPLRMDALASGALVACLVRTSPAWLVRWAPRVATVGVTALVVIAVWPSDALLTNAHVVRTVGFSVLAITFSAVVATAITASPASSAIRGMSVAPLRFYGKYSYAMYVFHPFVYLALITILRRRYGAGQVDIGSWPTAPTLLVASIVITTVLGVASWHLFERHFMRLRDRFPYEGRRELTPAL